MDPYHHHLPEVGHTRCYWALLSADLQFIYLDPVLAYHLDTEADLLIGKSLLSFVHPDEQASAKNDLRGVLESRTLHGSVTRVRLLRLSKIRRSLGHTGPSVQWSDAEKIAVDDNYIAVDIVINWAAEGLVLCFIHATVDLDPLNDNNELQKSHWTNWCGTRYMPPDQIQLLFRRLLICVPQSPSLSGTPSRIFQILSNQPRRQLLLSWPPDQGSGLTGREFAKLVENAEMGSGPQKGNDAKTSCTRRYRATQLMSPSLGEVESIFIPHGAVIFACHKVESSMRSTSTNPPAMPSQVSYDSNNAPGYPPPGPSYYEPPPYPPLAPAYSQGYVPLSAHPQPSTYSPPRWSQTQQQSYHQSQPPSAHTQWATPSPTHPLSPLPPPPTSVPPPSSMTTPHLRSYSTTAAPVAGPPPSWQTAPGGYDVYRASSPGYSAYPTTSSRGAIGNTTGTSILPTTSLLCATVPQQPPPPSAATASTASIPDIVPPPKRRVSPGSIRGSGDHQYTPATPAASGTGRSSGNRPSGILECSSCGATSSPEWRKGPSGKKELCNAQVCGLRYARSRAKKDGGGGTTGGSGHGRKKKSDTGVSGVGTVKTEPRDKVNYHHHHVVGGTGSSNGIEIKREIRRRKRDSVGTVGGPTPPLSTIAAAGGSPGYASTMLRKSFGSGSEYGASGTPPSGSNLSGGEAAATGHEHGHGGHGHYATLATGASAGGQSDDVDNDGAVTPSPSPPAAAGAPSSSTSGSMGLYLSAASPSSSSPPSSSGPPLPTHHMTSTPVASTTTTTAGSSRDIGFIHYNPPSPQPPPTHERTVPPLNVHPHSPHSPHSHSHSHSPVSSTSNGVNHPQSPHPVFSTAPAHYVHGYTATRPSPLSQAGNIVTGPAAGPLTPLSVPHSATDPPEDHSATSSSTSDSNNYYNAPATGGTGGMQLPPLAYMDRLVGSPSGSGGHNTSGHNGYGGGNGGDGGPSISASGSSSSASGGYGREPMTPLSAESPIGPGPGVVARNTRRTILGGQ